MACCGPVQRCHSGVIVLISQNVALFERGTHDLHCDGNEGGDHS